MPRGGYVTSKSVYKAELGSRDTGTIAGVVPLPAQTFYRQAFSVSAYGIAFNLAASGSLQMLGSASNHQSAPSAAVRGCNVWGLTGPATLKCPCCLIMHDAASCVVAWHMLQLQQAS